MKDPGTIPAVAFRVVKLIGFVESGLLPDAGGVNDQSASLVHALAIVSSEQGKKSKGEGFKRSNG